MNRVWLLAAAVVVFVGTIVAYSALFTVDETQQALVLQLGAPKRVVKDPGLNVKTPFVQNVIYYDDRILDYNLAPQEIPTLDQKQVVVDSFVRYRIRDPLKFYQTVNNEFGGQARIDDVISSNLRRVFGEVALATVLTEKRAGLMDTITVAVNDESAAFGINIIDVRIRRVDLPEENSQAVFRRMQTQREQEARKFRAEGQRDANFIRADADKTQRVIIAEARKTGEITRGEGDAEATRIYNDAYGKDPGFFDFFRSMQAMSKGLGSETTSFVGPPDGDFFRFFGDIQGVQPPAEEPEAEPQPNMSQLRQTQ